MIIFILILGSAGIAVLVNNMPKEKKYLADKKTGGASAGL
jgi:hypothetical protein